MIIEEKIQRITEHLNKGSGNITFNVNGTQVRTTGMCDKPGGLLVALQAVRNLEMMGFTDSFEESILLLYSANEIITNNILKKEIKKRNEDEAEDGK